MNQIKKSSASLSPWQKAKPFAILSLVSFLLGFGLLCLMLWKAQLLVALGLVGNVCYIVLLPLGLSAAAFVFGIFESYAHYKGKVLGGTLELGGPVVVFALVVIGGFYLPKPAPEKFSVTVFVHGEAGPHDLVLRKSGTVWLSLGNDLRHEEIEDKGQADFKNIPENFRGQSVPISVEAEGFEMPNPEKKFVLRESGVDLGVRRKAVRLSGRIVDTQGGPVTNATILAGETRGSVDDTGRFTLTPVHYDGSTKIDAEVSAPDFKTWRGSFVPNGGPATIQLSRKP